MSITSFQGPFPTSFSSPPRCSDLTSNSIVGFDFASSCLPKDFNPDPTAYYSPGTKCPSGYTAQDSCTRSSGQTSTMTCCPVRSDLIMWCVDDPKTLSGAWESMFCTWSAGEHETVLLVTVDETSTPAVTMSGADGINAHGLRMVYESSDLSTSTTAATATDTTSSDPGSSGGLSTGAKAAIGVVIPVVVIALAIGLFFLYRRRKQRYGAVGAAEGAAELPTEDKTGGHTVAASSELHGSSGMSYPGAMEPQEMPAQTFVPELPGSEAHEGTQSPAQSNGPSNSLSPETGHSVLAQSEGQDGVSAVQPPSAGHASPHS